MHRADPNIIGDSRKLSSLLLAACLSVAWLVGTAPGAPADEGSWYEGWCKKDEQGYSVVVDATGLPKGKRGQLDDPYPNTPGSVQGDGWFVRCHRGLEELPWHTQPWQYIEAIGVPMPDSDLLLGIMQNEILGPDVVRGSDFRIEFNVVGIQQIDGNFPEQGWPVGVRWNDGGYPGKPTPNGDRDTTIETPRAGMAYIVTAASSELTQSYAGEGRFYWTGVDPNKDRWPQYAPEAPQDPPSDDEDGGPQGPPSDDGDKPQDPPSGDGPPGEEGEGGPESPGEQPVSRPSGGSTDRPLRRPGSRPSRPGDGSSSGSSRGPQRTHNGTAGPSSGPSSSGGPSSGQTPGVLPSGSSTPSRTQVWGSDAVNGTPGGQKHGAGLMGYAVPAVAMLAGLGGGWWWFGRRRDEPGEASEEIDE